MCSRYRYFGPLIIPGDKFGILVSAILHVPDSWIFRALKIRPQIGFRPQIGSP